MFSRRHFLRTASASLAGMAGGLTFPRPSAYAADSIVLPFANGERPMVKFPGKRSLIGLTSRPPQLETPFSVFSDGMLTPNDAFFVRYHLAGIPLEIDPESYRIEIKGLVNNPLSVSLNDLKTKYPSTEMVAVLQCSGNSRGFVEPRVGGGQLGNGNMGNARWKGVALKHILDRVGVKSGAVQVAFGGLDGPVAPDTPDFEKALDIDHTRDGEVMLAYAMNGEDLPWLNGYPVRLVVPGWFGTYWVKHLSEVTVLDHQDQNYFMANAYRIPDNECACTEPGKAAEKTVPINRYNVRSFITAPSGGTTVKAGAPTQLRGIAFDGGSGIRTVELSWDDGASWQQARLGGDLGRYSFRQWTTGIVFTKGPQKIMVRATSLDGKTQPSAPLWSPSGYMRNAIESIELTAA